LLGTVNGMTLRRLQAAFTLIELLIVVALVAIVLMLGLPSFQDFILVQRLKSVSAQIGTDMQYARSEAAARGSNSRVVYAQDNPLSTSCYTIYFLKPAGTDSVSCDCLASTPCDDNVATEARTVRVLAAEGVKVTLTDGFYDDSFLVPAFGYDHRTGSLLVIQSDLATPTPAPVVIEAEISGGRKLRTNINVAGRVSVCAVGQGLGAAPCP
jgi:type IV fimbrial biogenesis protein FimT